MVARLKLKEIDGRAPPGVNQTGLINVAVNSAPKSSPMKRVNGVPWRLEFRRRTKC